jgi:hypothetical protein
MSASMYRLQKVCKMDSLYQLQKADCIYLPAYSTLNAMGHGMSSLPGTLCEAFPMVPAGCAGRSVSFRPSWKVVISLKDSARLGSTEAFGFAR